MNLVIGQAAPLRPAASIVWQTTRAQRWREELARIWREAMDAYALLARHRILPGVFW
jgi:hypothetical protein